MLEVRLYVSPGREEQYVTTVIIPQFLTAPEVIIWGTRIFRKVTDQIYHECFAVAAVYSKNDPKTSA